MSELSLREVSRDIFDRTEETLISDKKSLTQVVDDYFVERLKKDELQYTLIDSNLYEGLRDLVKREVLPLFEKYHLIRNRILERKQRRKPAYYVLGTIASLEVLEFVLTRGRSLIPQILIPSLILESFIGVLLFAATQYLDELQLNRARRQLERSIEGLDQRLLTDLDYDRHKELSDAPVLQAEIVEVLAPYASAEDFWLDYYRVRTEDPVSPSQLKGLGIPAFDKFLKHHVDGQFSAVARQDRFNRLFLGAQEIFISKDREHYALQHLRPPQPRKS